MKISTVAADDAINRDLLNQPTVVKIRPLLPPLAAQLGTQPAAAPPPDELRSQPIVYCATLSCHDLRCSTNSLIRREASRNQFLDSSREASRIPQFFDSSRGLAESIL